MAAEFFTVEAWTRRGLQQFLVLFFIELSTEACQSECGECELATYGQLADVFMHRQQYTIQQYNNGNQSAEDFGCRVWDKAYEGGWNQAEMANS